MRHIRNTLYVSQDGSYLHKDGQSIVVRQDKQKVAQFPLLSIGELVCFGFGIGVSPALAEYCSSQGITVTYLNGSGRFLARLEGPIKGNVLLRRQQYHDRDTVGRATEIARLCVAAKVTNQRNVLLRFLRNHADSPRAQEVKRSLVALASGLQRVAAAPHTDVIRGLEGEASAAYFSAFDAMVLVDDPVFRFKNRSRRPPRDPVNAMLSLVYSLLALDIRSALETVGLDPYVGFLHVERPGRPSLALDLMEEFRAPFADRLVLSLINLGQVAPSGFVTDPVGGVEMNAATRKVLLAAYQKRKREVIEHPFLKEPMEVGIAFLEQARLLARHVRGDLDIYPAFLWR